MIGSFSLGMPATSWQHQRIIRNLIFNYIYEFGLEPIEVLPEVRFEEKDPYALQPDIAFFDIENGLHNAVALVVVEIARNKQIKSTKFKDKIQKYFDKSDLEEVFIYDYIQEEWTRYTPSEPNGRTTSQSDTLEIDLDAYIYLEPEDFENETT